MRPATPSLQPKDPKTWPEVLLLATQIGTYNREKGEEDLPVNNHLKVTREEGAIRVTMDEPPGQHNEDAPDVVFERQPDKWMLFIRADGGDEVAMVDFYDDGRVAIRRGDTDEVLHEENRA